MTWLELLAKIENKIEQKEINQFDEITEDDLEDFFPDLIEEAVSLHNRAKMLEDCFNRTFGFY